jgi:hypothetical protein
MDHKDALKKAEEAKSYWSPNYKAWREDVRFSIGKDHYDGKTEEECREQGLLIVPILPQFIHQVVNDMRMNTPSIDVLPAGNGASKETAKIRKGLIRNIEYRSKADAVYDTASEYAVRGGFGFARVDHDYIDDESFLQELKLIRVQNPESVYLDPNYVECDGSDAEYGFILDTISKEEFERKYPGKEFTTFDEKPTDKAAEEIILCEFFIKEYEEIKKQMGDDGSPEDYVEGSEKSTRKLRKITIKRYRFSGADTLEETTFPGKYIPIVPFLGEEVWEGGKRHLMSLIRQAKDAQRRVNKWASKESEILDMSPIAPILAPYGSVEDFADEYTKVGDVNVIRYKQYDAQGQPLSKPERLSSPQVPTGFVNAMQEATEQAKAALGMYNASLGARSNETSGVAIDARKVEGEVATFHFGDNRNRSIQQIGRILDCAIPEVYDTSRIIQIIGDEEEPALVGINGAEAQEGQRDLHDLTSGKYDVRIVTGASFTTKRQEAAAFMGDLITKKPELMGIFGDIMFINMDVAGAEAIAARIKKTIPKELLADEEAAANGEQAPDPEKMQMAQMLEQMQAQIQEMGAELQSKQTEDRVKIGELEIKKGELAVKQGDLKLKYLTAFQQPAKEGGKQSSQTVPLPEDSVEIMQARLTEKMTQQQMAEQNALMEQEQAAIQAQMDAEQAAMKEQQEIEMKMAEMQQRDQQAAALIGTLNQMSQQIAQLTNQVSQPIQVIRDENGAIVGAS